MKVDGVHLTRPDLHVIAAERKYKYERCAHERWNTYRLQYI